MIDEPPGRFLMSPAQHREWAAILRRKGKPEKAVRHEQLARAIERIEQREAEAQTVASPPIAPASQ
jgi:hypothetical protein